ncbi:type II toxin-antitoxin system VapB family antitoxin [Brunnivagina elsteri]|uniref:DUF2281 domain-containing protein n=1 Tax=Brunnivagina elsteri CCALA 953 TaxID=987040 RepID=A0A2A2TC15_9CYAN|nr:DUF2281 domain-containing protein [Calothrix elsteri]PAX49849.1 hypothetical protein CK510_27435 [Calothrix elsteri CCALA 953]
MTSQVIDTTSEVITKLQNLAPEQQQQVLDFVEFLAQKYNQPQETKEKIKKPRVAGLHEGMGWMSDDFNEPLPDEFWLGES